METDENLGDGVYDCSIITDKIYRDKLTDREKEKYGRKSDKRYEKWVDDYWDLLLDELFVKYIEIDNIVPTRNAEVDGHVFSNVVFEEGMILELGLEELKTKVRSVVVFEPNELIVGYDKDDEKEDLTFAVWLCKQEGYDVDDCTEPLLGFYAICVPPLTDTPINLVSDEEDGRKEFGSGKRSYHSSPTAPAPNEKDFAPYYRPRKRLNDEVINAYMDLLNRKILPQREIDTSFGAVYFANSFLLPQVEARYGDYKKLDGLCRGWRRECPPSKHLSFVCCPVNVSNVHWLLFVACTKYRVFVVYDSMWNDETHAEAYEPIVRKKLDQFAYFLQRYEIFCEREDASTSPLVVPRGGWRSVHGNWVARYANFVTPQSDEDYYNCGVYVLTCAEILADHNVPYLYVTDVTIKDIRQKRSEAIGDCCEGSVRERTGEDVFWDYEELEPSGTGFRQNWDFGDTTNVDGSNHHHNGFLVRVNRDPGIKKTRDSYRLVDKEKRDRYNAELLRYKRDPRDPYILPPPSGGTILVFSKGKILRRLIEKRILLGLANLVWDSQKKVRYGADHVHVVTRLSEELESLFLFQRVLIEFLKNVKRIEKVTVSVIRKCSKDRLEKFVGDQEVVSSRDVTCTNPLYDPETVGEIEASDFMMENDSIYYLSNDFSSGTLEMCFYNDIRDLTKDVETGSVNGIDFYFSQYSGEEDEKDNVDPYERIFCEIFRTTFCRLYVNELNQTVETQLSVPRSVSSIGEDSYDNNGAKSFGYATRSLRHTYEDEIINRKEFCY